MSKVEERERHFGSLGHVQDNSLSLFGHHRIRLSINRDLRREDSLAREQNGSNERRYSAKRILTSLPCPLNHLPLRHMSFVGFCQRSWSPRKSRRYVATHEN